eukprot:XP_028335526.1 uncharacterized protein LOC114484290 [Physeter catodon]
MPHFTQQVELKGNSLSLSNKLKYFVNPRSTDSSSGDLRRLCSQIPDTEATIAIPDWVDDDGTAQRFAVSMSPGYRYIICWSFGHSLPGPAEKTRDGEASSTVVDSAGGKKLSFQDQNMAVILDLPFSVDLRVKGVKWTEEVANGPSVETPPHWKKVLLALPGLCGSPSISPVATLPFNSVKQGEDGTVINYRRKAIVERPPANVDQLDVCWCTSTASCTADEDFPDVVAKVKIYSLQRGLEIACSYDTQCPFEYTLLSREVLGPYSFTVSARKIGCNEVSVELPASGELVRIPPPAFDNPENDET